MDNERPKGPARLQLVLIALIFALPLVAALWMYYGDSAPRPAGRTNHGLLLSPPASLADELGASPLTAAIRDHWAMLYVQRGACDEACRDALYKLRQTRLMLGNDMQRVRRVLMHGPEAPDTLFLETEHAGLIALDEPAARQLFADLLPGAAGPGGIWLVDPLGNVVMYFPADILPRDLVEDVEHLLDLSRIG